MGVPYVRVGWLAMITSTQHPKYKLLCKILRHTWNLSTISDQNQGPGDLIDIGGRGAKICYPNCFLHRLFSFFTPLLFGEKNPMWLQDLSDRVADSHRTWVPIHKKNVLPTIKKIKKSTPNKIPLGEAIEMPWVAELLSRPATAQHGPCHFGLMKKIWATKKKNDRILSIGILVG